MTRKHTPGLFKRKASGYFGISHHQPSGGILVASREKLGTPAVDKPSTDTKLHLIDPDTLKYQTVATVMDVHDVHQIESDGDLVFLTDTGKNRVHVYDLVNQRTRLIINIGDQRTDIHHLNALHICDSQLHIGLNNRGNMESAILNIPMSLIYETEEATIDGMHVGQLNTLKGIHHTHDIEPYGDDYICSASHSGFVFRASNCEPIINLDNWVRGLCSDRDGIWVGTSPLASRSERHSEKLRSCIIQYSHETFQQIQSIDLHGSGQVNDLLCMK
ncbi:MAG: hypothetical protein GQ470_06400 [Gammaproteobacteria bacterium]|nr:hypothetical protein [Gammaproteobacteria bacterium]